MRSRKLLWTGMLPAIMSIAAVPAFAGVKEGVDAWQAGNYDKAIGEWRGPADQGDADAQFNLGQAYKLGRGVAADPKVAQDWYLKAAQQGHTQAQANLGLILFQNGDRVGALPWIRKAAERGEPRAQYVLGTAMFNGDLVPRDLPRAYAMMTRASAQGLPQATTSLQQMDSYISMGDRQIGLALAREMAEKTAREETADAGGASTKTPAPLKTAALPESTPTPPSKPAVKPVSKPAPKPAPAPAVASKRPAAGNGWRIQLGAFSSTAAAEKAWGSVAKIAELRGTSAVYTPVNNLTRLQAGPFAGSAEANKVCKTLNARNIGCFPVAP